MRWILALALAGCDGGTATDDSSGKTDDSGGTDGIELSKYINTNVTYTGDTTCFTPPTWLAKPTLCDGCTADHALKGWVEDFESGDNVPQADISLFFSDDISSAADVETKADANGDFSATVPACTPLGYKTSTPVEWEQTKDTYEVHQIWGFEADGELTEPINSVSVSTSKIIPAMLAVEWQPGTGIIAGTAYDCNEDPITGAQVVVRAEDGTIVDADIFYFIDSFPALNQPESSEDGLWVAVNVPPGDWYVDMYVWDGSTHVLMGTTVLEIKPDSVNISNVYTGHDDGIYYPASCIAP